MLMQNGGDAGRARKPGRWRKVAKSFQIDRPPEGVSFRQTEQGWQLAAVTRSPAAILHVLFFAVWLAMTALLTFRALFGEAKVDPLQAWLLVPLWLASLLLAVWAVLALFGHVGVCFDKTNDTGFVFTGLGYLRWKQAFVGAEILSIETTEARLHSNWGMLKEITLRREAGDIHLGMNLSGRRRRYLVNALNFLLD
ncbi:hypothetical protein [Blastopirellula marina]|uniref:Uncharacterized protein n=1 Tax=Blastopirellula marina TaxID=124 RepID=A0A2S8FNP3_9BACT|nr:hypothetical protein [Blastopirellula marina]PQO33600.1 hypothetical protein C5Y98_15270 [Blastopirellula marina]PTL43387.1 hypothetical protein C5Y97_15280 [Blastopirellula marina]